MKHGVGTKHYEESLLVPADVVEVFDYIDDHSRFSSHMNKSSWMMGGGKMDVSMDNGHGQKVGSHIRLTGNAFGLPLYVDEVVTQRERPSVKAWETVGVPKLLIIGHYQMRITLQPQAGKTLLTVSIVYNSPNTNFWLGKLFGGMYAKWCVRQMINGVRDYFVTLKKKL